MQNFNFKQNKLIKELITHENNEFLYGSNIGGKKVKTDLIEYYSYLLYL